VLRGGDYLRSRCGRVVAVRAADEELSRIAAVIVREFARAAYHLATVMSPWRSAMAGYVSGTTMCWMTCYGASASRFRRGEPPSSRKPGPTPDIITHTAMGPETTGSTAETPPTGLGVAVLTRILQLASPVLPVGAYAYSDGLEQAVTVGWVPDEASARDWILGLLEHSVARLDLLCFARLHAAWCAGDAGSSRHLSAWLIACRESAELRLTDRQLGNALARMLVGLDLAEAGPWQRDDAASFAALFALAAAHWQIPVAEAGTALLWSWCENMTTVAIKLVPLDQSAGQRLLFEAGGLIPRLVREGLVLADEYIAGGAPGQVIASSRHEAQHTRLFRS